MPLRYLVLIIVILATIMIAAITNPGIVPNPFQLFSSESASKDESLGDRELQLFGLINRERSRHQLPALKGRAALSAAARFHSVDMARNSFFSHDSPSSGSLRQRLDRFDVVYGIAGENIAEGFSVEAAHKALMKSPSHRENILNKGFGRVGIGIAYGRDGRLVITEDFTD